ncbi:hypothetical protein GCM10009625_01840 [Brachybacterium fresconis]
MTSAATTIAAMASGEILRGVEELESGAGRGRGRGVSPKGAEKLTDNLGCLGVGDAAVPAASQGSHRSPGTVWCRRAQHGDPSILSGQPVRDLSIR